MKLCSGKIHLHRFKIEFTLVCLCLNFTDTKNDYRVWNNLYFCRKAFLRKELEDTTNTTSILISVRLPRTFSFVSAAYLSIFPIQNPNQFISGDKKDYTFRSLSRFQYIHIHVHICIHRHISISEFVLHKMFRNYCICSY